MPGGVLLMPRLHPFVAGSFPAIELRATAKFLDSDSMSGSMNGFAGSFTGSFTGGSAGGFTGGLALSFSLVGDIAALILPAPTASEASGERRDHLWQSTCWECFLVAAHTSSSPGYFEINLSPAHHWNVYHFTDYRQGMTSVPVPPPSFYSRRQDDFYQLDALITGLPLATDAAGFADLASLANWRLGLAAVLATTDGGTGYLALTHPGTKPDFHHPDGFIFKLTL